MSHPGPSRSEDAHNVNPSPKFMSGITDLELQALTSTQKGFISTIRLLQQQEELQGDSLKATVADMFPPASLFSKELCDLSIVHTCLRDFLNARGCNLQQHSSRRILMTLATNVYDEGEDREAALDIVRDIISQGRRNRLAATRHQDVGSISNITASNQEGTSSISSDRVAHNVAMRLKDKEKKFSGELGESWLEFVDEYLQICRDYSLSQAHRLQYLHNLLCGDAKRFYLDKVDGYATSFQQAVQMVSDEYNSHVRQTRIKDYLNAIRVTSFMDKGLSETEALSKVYKLIVKLARQAPQAFRGDANKVEYLRNAVVGHSWAKEPLSRVGTMSLTFQQLHAELAASLQLEKDTQRAISRDNSSHTTNSGGADTHFTGQGRYRQNFRPVANRRAQNNKPRINPLQLQGCFNCGGQHMMKDCSKPIDTAKAAMRKLEYYSKRKNNQYAVHSVLADLCLQIDSANASDPDCDEIIPDHEVFETMVNIQDPTSHEIITGYQEVVDNELDNLVDIAESEEGTNSIYEVNTVILLNSNTADTFHGACVDSGAQRTVIGKLQAKAYLAEYGTEGNIRKVSNNAPIFSFGNHRYKAHGHINVRIPIEENGFINIPTAVVDINIPLLLGLETMIKYKVVLDVDERTLYSKLQGWSLELTLKRGHLYHNWNIGILFTENELRKVHNHFYHPEPERLYSLFKRADPSSASPQLLQDLDNINSVCDTCQREASAPHRFRVSASNADIVFNRENCLDLMKINGKQILHVVDRDTRFSAASFLHGESTKDVWQCYLEIWANKYIGFPDVISVDQGPQFRSAEWKSLLQLAGISFKPSGVESHNAINVGERYHSFLRKIYHKIESSHPSYPPQHILSLAVRAMNDTAGSNGLVPTMLVFGVLPRIPIIPIKLPDQVNRLKLMRDARKEMSQLIAKSKLTKALKMNVPSAAHKDLKIGDPVLVYRESPVNKWIGPFKILNIDKKMAYLDYNGELKLYSIDKLKLYNESLQSLPPAPNPSADQMETSKNIDDEYNMDLLKEIESIISNRENESLPRSRLADDLLHGLHEAHLTNILGTKDPECASPRFENAKADEIDGLSRRGTWKVIKRSELPPKSNVLGGRFVLTLKNFGTKEEKAKARYVAQGHKDREKAFMVHDLSTLHQSSIRLILSVAAIYGFNIFSHDVTQAYLQSKDPFSRELYLDPKPCDRKYFKLGEHEVLKLLRPLYGTCDAGDYWNKTIHNHTTNDLKMIPTKGDPSLYYKHGKANELIGIMGLYVDDEMLAGNASFEKLTEDTLQRFQSNPRKTGSFEFFGCSCEQLSNNTYTISQSNYISNLKLLQLSSTFSQFRSFRATLSWLTHTRPDISFPVNQFAQRTESEWAEIHLDLIKQYNKTVKYILGTCHQKLVYLKLNLPSVHLRVYSDASFAGNRDLTSQLGFIILLCDVNNRCHILDYGSKKSTRVVRSIMAGEMYAFLLGFDRCFVIQHDLQLILKQNVPIRMFTDSKQVFDAITKSSCTTERRLMIDLHSAKESYDKFEIDNVALISSNQNLADCFTKSVPKNRLQSVLRSQIDNVVVTQWIDRKK